MTYYFTSDWHLGHVNILKYSKRPFSSIEEMNNTIINNFNSIVKKEDVVYFLGDFFYAYKEKTHLNGHWNFIKGNHDKNYPPSNITFDSFNLQKTYVDLNIYNQKITICHYPMQAYNCSHFNAWMLYGHIHNDASNIIQGKKMNVGVDNNNFYPINFEQIQQYMNQRENNWDFIYK
jgi:calcineurin-like phosphoesterase family protein